MMAHRSHTNSARGYARDLPQPAQWLNPTAKQVFDQLLYPGTLVDMYIVEVEARPECTASPGAPLGHRHTTDCTVCARLKKAYGLAPRVVAYRDWDKPSHTDNAETYLARHIVNAHQRLGGIPWFAEDK
jgi:hypothetical protein